MRGSIKTVQVMGSNTGWLSMNNVWGAAWEIPQSPQPPLSFRLVDDSGSEVHCVGHCRALSITSAMHHCVRHCLGKCAFPVAAPELLFCARLQLRGRLCYNLRAMRCSSSRHMVQLKHCKASRAQTLLEKRSLPV